jgi:hypothetical protein
VSDAARIDYSDVMRKSPLPAIEDIKADLAASEEDIAAGRVVSGQVIVDRIQAALDGYETAKSREAETHRLLRR